MDALRRTCLFQRELLHPPYAGTPQCLDVASLNDLVLRGKARFIPAGDFTSVCVNEAAQGDVVRLPCGARTLLIDRETGTVHLRGVNKFFDIYDVSDAWMTDDRLWSTCTVWAQRKMAGFVVTLFSLDGERLSVMSKHVLEGEHVGMATAILEAMLTGPQRRAMARHLHALGASASCECITREADYSHPVLEPPTFDSQLVLFSVQLAHSVQERCLPYQRVQGLAALWGLPCVSGHQLHQSFQLVEVLETAQKWVSEYPPFGSSRHLAEGYVVLLEADRSRLTGTHCEDWVTPLRLKIKTTKYKVLRSFRELLTGQSHAPALLFHRVMLAWAALQRIHAVDEVRAHGVYALWQRMEAALLERRSVRHREASYSVGRAFEALITFTEREVHKRVHSTLRVILFCGLPASGKSTTARDLLDCLQSSPESSHRFCYGIHLSRDAVTRSVAASYGITKDSSQHKQRRLRSLVHKELRAVLGRLLLYSCMETGEGVLLLDACNATREGRRVWRQWLPRRLGYFGLVYLTCADEDQVRYRLQHRRNHDVLGSAEEAQRALYVVKKKFEPPTEEEAATAFDTGKTPSSVITEHLRDILTTAAAVSSSRKGGSPMRIMGVDEMDAEVNAFAKDLLHSLFGVEARGDGDVPVNGVLSRPVHRDYVVAVQLHIPLAELRAAAASALLRLLQEDGSDTGCGALLSWRSSLWDTIKDWIPMGMARMVAGRASDAVTVVAGHVKWLRGWLLQGKAELTSPVVEAALLDRFEVLPTTAHVTLCYSSSRTSGATEFWAASGWSLGQRVDVCLQDVLLDRHALCWAASVDGRHTQWPSAPHEPAVPLHVTLGTSPKVPSGYAGHMFAEFQRWGQVDAQLMEDKSVQQATRSRQKFHNFVRLRLAKPVECVGTVVEL